MFESIQQFVKGRVVHDLGCGSGDQAYSLSQMGALAVIGVDHKDLGAGDKPGVEFVHQSFENFTDDVDIAYVGWPVNHPTSLHRLTESAHTIIYVGSPRKEHPCGYRALWDTLRSREILHYESNHRESLIVYGRGTRVFTLQPLLQEERSALELSF